jgi:hypothetical protein
LRCCSGRRVPFHWAAPDEWVRRDPHRLFQRRDLSIGGADPGKALAVWPSVLVAIGAIWLLSRPPRAIAIGVSVLLAGAVVFRPAPPTGLLRASPLNLDPSGRLLYYAVGRSSSVVVLGQNGLLAFRTNGLPEAAAETKAAAAHISGEKWLLPLAVLSRPDTENLLLVGYGGGVVLEDVPDDIKHIDVVEIEPRVIDANEATRGLRKKQPLADGRVRVVINDARSALNLADARLYRPDPYTLIFVASKGIGRYPAGNAFPEVGINTPEDILVALSAEGQALRRLSQDRAGCATPLG